MAVRVSPTERIRAQIDDLFATEGDLGQTLEKVARLGARMLLQSALEAELAEFLGRNRYGPGATDVTKGPGSRQAGLAQCPRPPCGSMLGPGYGARMQLDRLLAGRRP